MLKGNHDYWWSTLKKNNEYLKKNNFKNIEFLQNNAFDVEDKIIAGTRGWVLFGEEDDEKILERELIRLELSIKDGIKKYGDNKEFIVCMHYPPTNHNILEKSDFIKLMQKYNVKRCIYGHLHAEGINEAVQGNVGGINLELISADYLYFKLKSIN